MKRLPLFAALLAIVLTSWNAQARTPEGIVYESEAISTPSNAWLKDQRTDDHWLLWTREKDIASKRSGGAVLASPPVAEDRDSPEAGAPPLHSVVTDLPVGTYLVYASNPGARPLAYSLDGETWIKHAGGELALGVHRVDDGRFELWVDDRYAYPPGSYGSAYYDYLRFVAVPDSAMNVVRTTPSPSLVRKLREDDTSYVVQATETTGWKGFERDGERIRGEHVGDAFSYTFDRAGIYYVALAMMDDVDGVEQLTVTFNGAEIGSIVADQSGNDVLFSLREPLEVSKGDTLSFSCETKLDYYRVSALYVSSEFIASPPPSIQHVEVWSPEPGVVDLCWTTDRSVETGLVTYGVGERNHKTEGESYVGRNHRVRLSGLDPTQSYDAQIVTSCDGQDIVSEFFSFRAAPPLLKKSKSLEIPIAIAEPTGHLRKAWPATIGMPFAQGTLARVSDLSLARSEGGESPLQAECFSRWPDGSVKWATLSWLADSGGDGADGYVLRTDGPTAPRGADLLRVEEGSAQWRIQTDSLAFDLAKEMPALFHNVGYDRNGDGVVTDDERIKQEPLGANLRLVDEEGGIYTCGAPAPGSFSIEQNGPVAARITWSGPLINGEGASGWSYLLRVRLWKGLPAMAVNVTVINEQKHPTFRALTSLALRVPLDGEGGVQGAFDGAPMVPVPDKDSLWIHQEKDNHFALWNGSALAEGERSQGVTVAEDNRTRATVVHRDFWETYPSGGAIGPDGIHVRLLPELKPDTYDGEEDRSWYYKLYSWNQEGKYLFRAGQATQHEVFVHYGAPGSDTAAMGEWFREPLLPQAPPAYLCATGVLGRPLFPRSEGLWDDYEAFFEESFEAFTADREERRTYGWMHFGDWYGERGNNYGNNEYALDWALGMQWMRTGDRRYFERGLEMARHYSTVDTILAEYAAKQNGLVWEHSFNHVGTPRPAEALRVPESDKAMQSYLKRYEWMLRGAMDRQGHIFEQGVWLYAALTGDPWLRDVAERVCDNQASQLTPDFDFGIERSGGWPLINASNAYLFSGNPYYLNAARIMVERCLMRQDPDSGGWLHTPPKGETDNVPVLGGKAFAVGILTHGLLRYVDVEPMERPEVNHMLVRGADWLMKESWEPGNGFVYITNAPKYRGKGTRGMTCALNAEAVAFAYEETGDAVYLDFWREMMNNQWQSTVRGMGKSFTQATRQSVFGLDRVIPYGITSSVDLWDE